MKVAVFEFVCGGGLTTPLGTPSPSDYLGLYSEGLGMLAALVSDLSLAGHSVATCLDTLAWNDPSSLQLRAHPIQVKRIETTVAWLDQWLDLASDCEQSIIIAPELDDQLVHCVAAFRDRGIPVLASSQAFLEATSDKMLTAEHFQKAGVNHPPTGLVKEYVENRWMMAKPSGSFPVTIKRRDGAGCVGMQRFDRASQLDQWIASHLHACDYNRWLIQPWMPGIPVSLAMVVHAGVAQVLGNFYQHVHVDSPIEASPGAGVNYRGGSGPVAGVSLEEMESFASNVLGALPPGAEGWIGIDFLIPEDSQSFGDWIMIEVNPRLTTSYLGYRQWYGLDMGRILLGQAVLESKAWSSAWPKVEFHA